MGIVVKRENRKDISELKKIGEKHFEQRLAYENQLIEAYNSKKLKSEKLIDSKRYKTIKGHARRNQFEFVFNFFRKNYPDEFMYLAKFMCTKTIRDTAELIKEEP